jgi:hypothetical protein
MYKVVAAISVPEPLPGTAPPPHTLDEVAVPMWASLTTPQAVSEVPFPLLPAGVTQ